MSCKTSRNSTNFPAFFFSQEPNGTHQVVKRKKESYPRIKKPTRRRRTRNGRLGLALISHSLPLPHNDNRNKK
jgi:hypothetical protein